jgi:membrane protein
MAREVYARFVADDGLPLAGNIAYHTILAAFPFLIILTALAGFLGNGELARQVVTFLMDVGPRELIEPFVAEIESILSVPRTDFLSLGILLTLWTASGGVDSVRIGLNRAYGLKEHRRWYILLGQNLLFVVGGAIVLMALALLIVFAPLLIGLINDLAPGLEPVTAYYDTLRFPLALLVLTSGVIAAHLFLPARWLPWRDMWPGIFFTVFVWLAVGAGYSIYLARFSHFASTYAGLGGLIAGLIFLYLMAAVMLLGGEINRAIRLRRNAKLGLPEQDALGASARDKGKAHRADNPPGVED